MPTPVPCGPIDSHCHLQLLDAEACDRALDAARETGVGGFLIPAITLADCDRLLELASREGDIWCALGVHPHEASSWRDGDQDRLRLLLNEPRVVAVGECGLDFHYDRSPRDVQLAVMRQQWEIAQDVGLPVIVHNRDSNDVMLDTVRRASFNGLRGVFHSFAGGTEMAQELLGRGFYLGLSGMVTFRAADNVRAILPDAPGHRLLVETDTPYLAPVPYRGMANQPAYVVEIVERLATETGLSPGEVAAGTTRNFFSLFSRASGDSEARA